MRFFKWILLAIILTIPARVSAQTGSPAEVISTLYRSYGVGGDIGNTGLDDPLAVKLFDSKLLALYKRAVKRGLDADFFVQGQDFSLVKPIEIGAVAVVGDKAKVPATLTQSFEGKTKVDHFIFTVVKTSDGWRLDDAVCRGGSLRNWLAK